MVTCLRPSHLQEMGRRVSSSPNKLLDLSAGSEKNIQQQSVAAGKTLNDITLTLEEAPPPNGYLSVKIQHARFLHSINNNNNTKRPPLPHTQTLYSRTDEGLGGGHAM